MRERSHTPRLALQERRRTCTDMPLGEPNYGSIISRLLNILQSDEALSSRIKEFRFGELPEQHFAKSFPACYVTTSRNPEVSRDIIGSANDPTVAPSETIITEFWIVFLEKTAKSEQTQKSLYELVYLTKLALRHNNQLRKSDGTDPMCAKLDIHIVPRFTELRGMVLDGITLMVRTINHVKSPVIS